MDKLTEMFETWKKNQPGDTDGDAVYPAFQGGLTAGAVSMRQRAIAVIQDQKGNLKKNDVLTQIGQLSDIPL